MDEHSLKKKNATNTASLSVTVDQRSNTSEIFEKVRSPVKTAAGQHGLQPIGANESMDNVNLSDGEIGQSANNTLSDQPHAIRGKQFSKCI